MHHTAARVLLIFAIVTGALSVRSIYYYDLIHFRIRTGGHMQSVLLYNGYGNQSLSYSGLDYLEMEIPSVTFKYWSSSRIDSKHRGTVAANPDRWWFGWNAFRDFVIAAPAWFTSAASFLLFLIVSLAPRIRATFRRKATLPPVFS
ncbi:MAG: hypothetical protein ABI680_16640 [Chthoniobacteraceae bacterium]